MAEELSVEKKAKMLDRLIRKKGRWYDIWAEKRWKYHLNAAVHFMLSSMFYHADSLTDMPEDDTTTLFSLTRIPANLAPQVKEYQ